jgi:hypothetical protein
MYTVGAIKATLSLDYSAFRAGVASVRSQAAALAHDLRAQMGGAGGSVSRTMRGMAGDVRSGMRSMQTEAAAGMRDVVQTVEQGMDRVENATRGGGGGGGRFGGIGGRLMGMATGWAAGLVTVSALAAGVGKAFEATDRLDASQRELAATAKITGQNLGFLQKTAADTNDTYRLGGKLSNEYAIALTKLTSKAGEVDKTGEAIARALDLGAARGLTAAETLQAVEQAIIGVDEGTDKLLGMNPSVAYQKYAESIGTTAAKLTEAGKAQAIYNELHVQGGKVAGEYAEWLKSPAGQQQVLRIKTEEAAASIGRSMNGIRTTALPVLADLAEWTAKAALEVRIWAAGFPMYAAQVKLWAAEVNDSWGGALEAISGKVVAFAEWTKTLPEWAQKLFGFTLKPSDFVMGNAARIINRAAATGVDDARKELEAARNAYNLEAARLRQDMKTAITGDTSPVDFDVGPLSEDKEGRGRKARERDAIRDAINVYKEANAEGLIREQHLARLATLHDTVSAALRRELATHSGTVESLTRELDLREKLRDIEGVRLTRRANPDPVDPGTPAISTRVPLPAPPTDKWTDFESTLAKINGLLGRTVLGMGELTNLAKGGITETFMGLGAAIEAAFAAGVDGSRSMARAFGGTMLTAIAQVARGFGQTFLGLAAGAVGTALLTGDVSKLGAAAKLTAAGLGLMAIAGGVGAAGATIGTPGGFAGQSAGGRGASDAVAGAQRPEQIIIYVQQLDPQSPAVQRVVYVANGKAVDRFGAGQHDAVQVHGWAG